MTGMTTAPESGPSAREQLGAVLASIEADELTCSAAMRHRIEGALLALGILDGRPINGRMSDASGTGDDSPADLA